MTVLAVGGNPWGSLGVLFLIDDGPSASASAGSGAAWKERWHSFGPAGLASRNVGMACSMSGKRDGSDNGVADSFFATLEKDYLQRHSYLNFVHPLEHEMLAAS